MPFIVLIAWGVLYPPLFVVYAVVALVFVVSSAFGGRAKDGQMSFPAKQLPQESKPTVVAGEPVSRREVFAIKGMLRTYGSNVSQLVRGGEVLRLKRDAGNKFDCNAILAMSETGDRIGYVAKEVAARLAPELDAGSEMWVKVLPDSYTEWSYGRCDVELMSKEDVARLKNRVMVKCARCGGQFDARQANQGDMLWCPVCHMAHNFLSEPSASLKPYYFFERSSDADAIEEFARERDIRRILHFTSFPSLLGIFKTGFLMSRSAMDEYAIAHPESRVDFHSNDAGRWDMRLNCINMSIERANTKLLWVMRQREENSGREPWCILEIDPVCMEKAGVYFTVSNAASAYVRKHGTRFGIEGLRDLFAESITSGRQVDGGLTETYVVSRDSSVPLNRPTDGQAEVLVPGSITTKLIKRIICRSQSEKTLVHMELSKFVTADMLPEIVVDSSEFDDYQLSRIRGGPARWR